MLAFRYLAKEVFITLIALTFIMMFILLSNQFVWYLNRAASGRIPGMLILQLMSLEMPNFLSLLLPIGFFISVILAFGRLYSENEMMIFHACGMSMRRVLAYVMAMAGGVTLLVVLMIYLNPASAHKRAKLLQTSGMKAFIQMLAPQQFQVLPNQQVLYIDKINRGHTKAQDLFIAKMNQDPSQAWQWQIIAAHKLALQSKPHANDELVMSGGRVYRLSPGSLKAQYGTFEQAILKIPETTFNPENDLRALPLATLWQQRHLEPAMNVELLWRLSIAIMTLVMTVVAVPLSRVNPRSGKFSKIFPAILIFLIYINLLFIWHDRALSGLWERAQSVFLIHCLIISIGIFLFWQQKRRLS